MRFVLWSTGPDVAVAQNTEWQDAVVEPAAQNTQWQDADVEFPCTIDVVDVNYFSMSVFRANYALKKPLVVRGGAKNWAAQTLWTKSFMKEQYGSARVTPQADTNQPTTGEGMGFQTFLESMNSDPQLSEYNSSSRARESPLYVFQRWWDIMSREEFQKAVNSMMLWEILGKPDQFDQYIMIGSNGTGLFWHAHDCAWNACIQGKRRWFLFSGGTDDADSIQHQELKDHIQTYREAGMRVWADSYYPSLPKEHKRHILQCVQEKGDMIYVPQGVEHAVVNYGDTVAVAMQSWTTKWCPEPGYRARPTYGVPQWPQ